MPGLKAEHRHCSIPAGTKSVGALGASLSGSRFGAAHVPVGTQALARSEGTQASARSEPTLRCPQELIAVPASIYHGPFGRVVKASTC